MEYEWFDFHGECKGMKWENISRLIAKLLNELECYDYFMALIEATNVSIAVKKIGEKLQES